MTAMYDSQDLARRIERLERSNARWKHAAAALMVLGLTALASAWRPVAFTAPVADEIEATRFVLRGPDGEEAAVLGLDSQGKPSLLMRQDKAYAFLTLSGPGLLLRGDDGKRTAFLGFDTKGATELNLSSPTGSDGLRLNVQDNGTARVSVLGANGFERAAMGYSAINETSNLVTSDSQGRIRTAIGLDDGDKPSFVLMDERSVRRIGMFLEPNEEGLPFFGLQDEKARGRVEFTTSFDGTPILALRRSDGTPAFQAP